MQMTVGDDDDKLLELLADKLLDQVDVIVDKRLTEREQHDDVVNAKWLYTNLFHCSSRKFEQIRNMPGFPSNPNPGGKPSFSRKAVEKWIADNQQYS